MRWFWIDCFREFVSGQYAVAIKNVSMVEPQLIGHFTGYPVMPNSLVIEGMAQTGGLLVSEYYDFRKRIVLAKLARSVFDFHAVPGDTLRYRATIRQIREDGAMVTVESHIGDRHQGEAEIYFAHLDDRTGGQELFEPAQLRDWLVALRVFHVAKKADGRPVVVPPHLAGDKAVVGCERQ